MPQPPPPTRRNGGATGIGRPIPIKEPGTRAPPAPARRPLLPQLRQRRISLSGASLPLALLRVLGAFQPVVHDIQVANRGQHERQMNADPVGEGTLRKWNNCPADD